MVKKGKKSKTRKELEKVLESNPEVLAKGDDAWTTGNAFDMLVDEDEQGGAGDMEDVGMKSAEAAPKQKGVGAMDTGDGPKRKKAAGATTTIPGLGVVHHSLKRGDRTTNQKKRKAIKLAKALSRTERSSVKANAQMQKKTSKAQLKHMY